MDFKKIYESENISKKEIFYKMLEAITFLYGEINPGSGGRKPTDSEIMEICNNITQGKYEFSESEFDW